MKRSVVINVFGRCCKPKKKPKAAKYFTFRWYGKGSQTFVEGLMARITTEQQVPITVEPKTLAGRPAAIDGDVVFGTSDPAVATVTSTGPKSAMVVSVAPGVAQITATFDADLDAGEERMIPLSGVIEVVAAEAETGEILFGDPELTPLP
jgi:hypothetical protein